MIQDGAIVVLTLVGVVLDWLALGWFGSWVLLYWTGKDKREAPNAHDYQVASVWMLTGPCIVAIMILGTGIRLVAARWPKNPRWWPGWPC